MIFDHFITKFLLPVAFEICYFYPSEKHFRIYGENRSFADHVYDAGVDPCVVSQGTKAPTKPDSGHLCLG
jgi:hypothetical protein